MTTKWTPRRNGLIETTVALSLHIPQDLVTWLKDKAGISEKLALAWIKSHVQELTDDWHTIQVDDGYQSVIHVDNKLEAEGDGYVVYDGPMPVLQATTRRHNRHQGQS